MRFAIVSAQFCTNTHTEQAFLWSQTIQTKAFANTSKKLAGKETDTIRAVRFLFELERIVSAYCSDVPNITIIDFCHSI